jgi:GTP-binding protein HflX
MLEVNQTLLPKPIPGQGKIRALCVGLNSDSLDEMDRLLTTLGLDPIGRMQVSLRSIHPAIYIGKGKLEEVGKERERIGAECIIFDVELSPNQLRNIEKILEKPVLDRPGVIIEIFSAHARTKESKTQVELARLQYLLPRLTHFWTHFEKQRGGIGLKGMGEKQIEVDRRLVKKRMSVLNNRLADIEKERKVQRAGRQDVLKVALVGYTNAGKSTLLNALTHSHVRAEDKLFATLDASIRTLDPHSHPPIVAVDTVGFIRNLPTTLVASFRSTLEELHQADLLLHVVDGSSPRAREELEVTEGVLKELGVASKPRLTILNKADLAQDQGSKIRAKLAAPGAVLVSAFSESDVTQLRSMILKHFTQGMDLLDVMIPYGESKLEAQLHAHSSVETKRHMEKGTFYRIRIEDSWAKKLRLDKYKL